MKYTISIVRTKKELLELLKMVRTTWIATYTNPERNLSSSMIAAHIDQHNNDEYIKMRFKALKGKNRKNWVAKNINGRIIGWIGCEINNENIGSFGIYILPSYQGHGVGTKLLSKAIKWLGRAEKIEINVLDYNKKTIQFYKKFGLKFNGKKDDFIVGKFVGKGWSLRMELKK